MTKSRRRRPGAGSIYRRASDGKWVAVVPVQEGAGPRKRLYLYGDSATEVEDKLAEAQRRMRRGILPTTGRLTVGRYLADWLEGMRINVRPSMRPTLVGAGIVIPKVHFDRNCKRCGALDSVWADIEGDLKSQAKAMPLAAWLLANDATVSAPDGTIRIPDQAELKRLAHVVRQAGK